MNLLCRLRSVSEPFDAASKVELKFDIEGPYDVRGELYLRVPEDERKVWLVDDVYFAAMKRL